MSAPLGRCECEDAHKGHAYTLLSSGRCVSDAVRVVTIRDDSPSGFIEGFQDPGPPVESKMAMCEPCARRAERCKQCGGEARVALERRAGRAAPVIPATLNTIGLRCPDCGARLVYAATHEYRCTGVDCGGLYLFRLDALDGITLTFKDERFLNRAMDGVSIQPERHLGPHPRLSLVHTKHPTPPPRAADC